MLIGGRTIFVKKMDGGGTHQNNSNNPGSTRRINDSMLFKKGIHIREYLPKDLNNLGHTIRRKIRTEAANGADPGGNSISQINAPEKKT